MEVVMFSIVVFLASAFAAFYIVVGYPLLLAVLVRLGTKPVLKDRQAKSVSFVIAVRNGEQFIADKLASILDLDYPRELMEIIIVSDGSTDRTVAIAEQFLPQGVRVVEISASGKCAALNKGISVAQN